MKKLSMMILLIFSIGIVSAFGITADEILVQINNAINAEQIEELITENAAVLNIDLAKVFSLTDSQKMAVYNALIGKNYRSTDELKYVFYDIVKDTEKSSGGISHGGGGGFSNPFEGILEVSITVLNEKPTPGDTVTATAHIKNISAEDFEVENFTLRCGEIVSDAEEIGSLASDEMVEFTMDFTLATLPAFIELWVDDTIIAIKKLGGAELEISDLQFVQKEDDGANSVFDITGKVKNIGYEASQYIYISAKKGEDYINIEGRRIDYLDIGAQEEFALTVSIANFITPQLEITILAEDGDISATQALTLVNGKVVTDIILNDGNALSIMKNASVAVKVDFVPATSAKAYMLSVLNTDIATVNEDGISITAKAEGTTKLSVSASGITKEIDLTVTKLKSNNELDDIKVYYMEGETKHIIPLNKKFEYFTYTGYRIDLTENISRIGFDIEAPAEAQLTVYKADNDRKMIQLDEYSNLSVPMTSYNRLLIYSKVGAGEAIAYEVIINFKPVATSDIPSSITVFTDYECETDITNYYDDYEDDKNLSEIYVEDTNGTKLGSVYTDEDKKRYWRYKSVQHNEGMNARFVFIDKNGAITTKDFTIVSQKDEQAPVWTYNEEPSISYITTSSAKIKWNKATDNDVVDHYVVNYYRYATRIDKKTVSAGKDISAETTISGLSSGTEYKVYIEAVDRSGNVVKSKTGEFDTRYIESSGGGSGGGGVITTPTPTPTPTPAAEKFTDLAGFEWAKDAIIALAEKGVINGISENLYAPADNITRADFITLLVRGLKLQSEFDGNFSDVSEDSYYYNTVGMARALGIVTGSGGAFMPEENITRQDMIVMTARALQYAQKLTITENGNLFADDSDIADYAKQSVYALSAAGIIKGDLDGNVLPQNYTIRAEAAVIIYRILTA